MTAFGDQLPRHSLVVSCQAAADSPLRSPDTMRRIALAVALGGATAIRANGPADVKAIREAVDLPLIGINKIGDPSGVFITPTVEAARAVIEAGATIVALDGTRRPRPDGLTLHQQISAIRDFSSVPLMADVDSVDAGMTARDAGADAVATTLSGYVGDHRSVGPDIGLISELAARLDCEVVAEGRIWTASHIREALDAGAHAVVVGTAITNPTAITRRLSSALDPIADGRGA